jgi:hypothetical protein
MDTSRGFPARVLELELEPLSEQRWSKIEHSLFARLDAGEFPSTHHSPRTAGFSAVRAGSWAVGLAAVALAAVFVLAPLRSVTPSVSRISTGVVASHVALPGVVLDVSPESAVVVSGSTEESAFIALDRGQVTCEVAHRRPGAPLIIQAGEVSVEVVGTRFSVTRKDDAATVSVQEGVVRVKFREQTALVRAGETWPFAPLQVASVQPAPGAVALGSAPSAVASEGPPMPDNAARVPRARESNPKASRDTQKKLPEASPSSASATVEVAPPSLQSQFELASQLEARDPVAAIRLYEGLENSSGSWAANALFAHGRLEAARGNNAVARRILDQYLARFPGGTNVPDARLLIGRLK